MASQSDLYLLGIGYRHVKGGEDDFAGAGKKIKQSGREAADAVSALEAATGSAAAQFAAALTPANAVKAALGALAAAAALAGFAIHKALEEFAAFEQAMKNVKAVSGSTEAQLASLSDAALDLSRNSRFDPKQVAEGLYALASAGLDASKQLQALPGNMAYAEAAQTSLGQATETTLLALNNFNLSADQTTRVADVFTAAIGKSAFNADRLSVALRNAAPAAGTMNQSFEGTMSVLSVLVKRFNDGALAGTGFKVALAEVQAKAKDLGIQVRDTHGNMLPMADILDVLEKRGIHAKDSVALFGQEAGPALAVLMQTGSKALREMQEGLAANGQAAATSKDQLDTLEGSQKILANSIEVFWIKLGRALSGGQRDLNQELIALVQRATDWVVEHADEIGHAWEKATAIAKGALEILVKIVEFIGGSGEVFNTLKEVIFGVAAAWAAVKVQTILATAWANTYALATGAISGIEALLLAIRAGWAAITLATEEATAAMLANPIGLIAVAVGLLVFAIQRYIDKTNEAWELELKRTQTGQTYALYLADLKTKTDLLTDAEAAHGRQMLANLAIEAQAARVAADKAVREDPEANRSLNSQKNMFGRVIDTNVPYTKDTQDAVAYAKQLEQTQAQMEERLRALGALSDETITVTANATADAGKAFQLTDKGLKKTLDTAELAAKRAEALYAAQQQGLPVVLSTTRSFELQDAALAGIEAKNMAAARALAAFGARLFDANRLLALLVDTQQRDIDTGEKLAAARAAVTDAIAGNNLASQAAARAAEVEAFRQKFLLAVDDDRVKKLRTYLELRDRELRLFAQEAAAAAREIEFNAARRTTEAALEDARNQSTEASRGLAVQLEIESRLRSGEAADLGKTADQIAAEVIGRHAVTAALADQASGAKSLAQTYKDLDQFQARFADSQQVRAATKALGSEIAGILEKYGLLSDATKELEIHERALAVFSEEHGTRTVAAIEEELRARQKVLDVAARGAAAIEIAQLQSDKLFHSVAGIFGQLSEELGGASTSIGRITGAIGGVVASLGTLRDAGKAWSVDWNNAMVGAIASVGALLKELNIGASNKTGGAQALGGRLDSNYSGIGALVGTIIGGIIGAIPGGIAAGAGAAIGGAIGTVLGSMISKAGDSASATLLNGGNIQINESSRQLNGAVRDALLNIFKGLNAELASMGMMLDSLPFIDIKVRDNIIRVIVGNVVRTFASMNDAISFGIAEALRQSATSGGHLPPEVLAALKNSTATDLEALKSDIAFAQSIANYGVPAVVQSIDKAVSDFFVAMQRAAELGIDSTKVIAQFADQIKAQKDAILGIDRTKSPQDQLRDNVVAFNQRMDLLQAEKQADLADLLIKKAGLQAQIAQVQAEAELTRAHVDIGRARLEGDAAVDQAALSTLVALQSALAAVDVAIAATQAIIDSIIKISDEELAAALARIGKGGKGGAGGPSLMDQVNEARRAREVSQMSAFGQGLTAINDKWDKTISEAHLHAGAMAEATKEHNAAIRAAHGNADAIKKANEHYANQTRHIKEGQAAMAAANAEREAEIALLRQQTTDALYGKVADYEKDPNRGSTPQGQLADIQDEAQALRDEFTKTATELGFDAGRIAAGLARITAAETAREKALAEAVIQGLGLPMEQTRTKAKGLGDAVAFLRAEAAKGIISVDRLNDVLGQLGQQAQLELFGMAADLLDQMGRFDEADKLRRSMDEINFQIQRAQLNFMFQTYVAAGIIFGDLQVKLQGILDVINDRKNWPDFSKPAPQRPDKPGGPTIDGNGSAVVADDVNRRKAILDQITAWNRLGESDVTSGLRDLHDTLVGMQADARRLGISLSDLMAANAHAVEDFWNRTLAPYENGASTNVLDRLAEINRNFDEMITAAQQYGGDQARIEADRLRAVEAFWTEALQPLRDLQQQFQQGNLGGGMTPEQRLAAAQQRFNDLAARAMAGDAAAIQALPDAVQALLDQQRAFSGTGPAYQALVATIQGVLDQILALGGAVAPAAGTGPRPPAAPAPAQFQFGATPPPPRPVPVPAGATGGPQAQIPIYADHVDRLVGAIGEDAQSQRDGRANVQQLRAQVDRLVSVTREQSQQISDLVATTKRLTALAESNERRTGGARRVA